MAIQEFNQYQITSIKYFPIISKKKNLFEYLSKGCIKILLV